MSQTDPTFSDFYADYLAHHRHPLNRALHLAAKLLAIAGLAAAVHERSALLLLAVPVLAVAPCWLGHLLFEGNRPVSWSQPSASLLGAIAGIGGIAHRRDRRRRRELPAPGRPSGAAPPRPAGGRPYYSFAADLRMCGAMFAPRSTARASNEPT